MPVCCSRLLFLLLAASAAAQTPPAKAPAAAPPAAPAAPTTAPAAPAAAPRPAKPIPKLVPKKLPRYNADQISAAIAKKVADKTLSRDLKTRGVPADLNRDMIERFRSQGAGPETLAVLTQSIPRGSVIVQTEPGAAIAFDGNPAGVADAHGGLKLDPVDAGPHQVKVTKEQRRDFSQIVNVRANQQEIVTAALPWTVGYISVDPKYPEAKISISDAGNHVGLVQKLPVSVGEHVVTVTLPLRRPFRVAVNVRGGENVVVPVKLVLDPAALKDLEATIGKTCEAKDFDTAERQILDYQRYASLDSGMLTCLSIGYLKRHQNDEFLKLAGQALAQGGEFTFPVQHIHGARRRGIHDALLTIRQNEIHYEPKGKCNLTAFSRLRKDAQWTQQPVTGGSAELTLTLPEANSKKLVMNFVEEDADRLLVIYRLATQPLTAPASRVQ